MEIGALNERVHHHVTGLRRELAKTAREAQYGTLKEFVMGFPTARTDQDQGDANAHIQLSHKPFPERINAPQSCLSNQTLAKTQRDGCHHRTAHTETSGIKSTHSRHLEYMLVDGVLHMPANICVARADLLMSGLVKLLSAS